MNTVSGLALSQSWLEAILHSKVFSIVAGCWQTCTMRRNLICPLSAQRWRRRRQHSPVVMSINTQSRITLQHKPADDLYNRVKKTQLDAQFILSIFRQLLYVSGVSRPIIRRYNSIYTTVGCIQRLEQFQSNQDSRQSFKKNNKYRLLYKYGCTS
jgi:hypothetical protein